MLSLSISLNKCNYCGSKVLLIENYGECPKGCPGNVKEIFVQECNISDDTIIKLLAEE